MDQDVGNTDKQPGKYRKTNRIHSQRISNEHFLLMLGMQVLENKIAYFHLKHHPVSVSYGYNSILVILRELRSRDLQYYTAWFY